MKHKIEKVLKKYLTYDVVTDEYILRPNNMSDLSSSLLKLFNTSDVSESLKCDCKHSGTCRYEEVILETKELCRHKE